jgi:hypothetical protein
VEDIAAQYPSDAILFYLYCPVFLHLHDHLTTSEERVADELARAQSNLGVGHDGLIRPATLELDAAHNLHKAIEVC